MMYTDRKNIHRFYMLTLSCFTFFFTCHSACSQSLVADRAKAVSASKPNIVIIMADDLDSRQLSCYGGENLKTTHIDRLAEEGLQFNNLIASEAMCVPTRASLFTGLYPARHGAYQNHKPVVDNIKSVAHYLTDLGYRVGLSGKDHMTKPKSSFPFTIISGFEPNCVAETDDYFLDSIAKFMQEESPYCLFLMSINPHAPWTVGDPDEFDPQQLKLPAHWVDTEPTRRQFAKYLAEVRRLDNQVGDVLALLDSQGRLDNTLVIFLGEQGPQFPGGKWTLYDNGQRSSMLIRWPKVVQAPSITEAIVQYEDITPLLIDIAGGKPLRALDGKSFRAVLKNPKGKHRDFAYGIHNNIPEGPAFPIRSVRDQRYKLIWNLNPESIYHIKYMTNTSNKGQVFTSWHRRAATDKQARFLTGRIVGHPEFEFYDLQQDPDELHNLAGDPAYNKIMERMRKKLRQWMKAQHDTGLLMDVPF
ncbi:sulfatase family protein [Sphingobacterium paludis]|uniref:Arylsulfatase A-like enzyme n=1 Tax=Sphingobacterium paludis TaxID=1476465 RepID=A0A4R7CTY1_9SPHI|nr:sulfatase [Sphingobacterium paludis]TDS11883.1 arylsulfatase A-like enzyme [Sphingobacterium paludis]